MTRVGGGLLFSITKCHMHCNKEDSVEHISREILSSPIFPPLLSQTKLHIQLESVSDSHSHPLTTIYQKKKKRCYSFNTEQSHFLKQEKEGRQGSNNANPKAYLTGSRNHT